MNKFVENLKRQCEENPLVAVGVAAAALTAVAKLTQSANETRNSKTWAREVERRRMKTFS